MSETGSNQEQNLLRRFWWLIVLLALLLIFLCAWIGPAKNLFSPPPPTEKVTEQATEAATPPPNDAPTDVVTETSTDNPTEAPTEKETEKPTATATSTKPPTAVPTEVITVPPTEESTQASCVADPNDGVCNPDCENAGTDPACGPAPKCGSDCSTTGYCGDGSNGLFCDNGTCNGVQCEKPKHHGPTPCPYGQCQPG